ncbi:ParB N-terminal domain-containing protein, partial [Mariniblastus sp.]|nr:ParB N-terminal domain-containing protein [Mariniblastus sp.]
MYEDLYRVFPSASKEERERLKQSIDEVGLKNPVVIDEHGNVIDGHDRRDVCEELDVDWKVNAIVKMGLSEAEKVGLAIELNLWRKSIIPNAKQKKELVEKYLQANPQVSGNRIADLFGISQSTASRITKSLIQVGRLEKPLSTIGKDGVEREVGVRKKKSSTLMVKNDREFNKLSPALVEAGADFNGVVRIPKKIVNAA